MLPESHLKETPTNVATIALAIAAAMFALGEERITIEEIAR